MKPVSGAIFEVNQARIFWERFIWPRIQPELAAGRRLRVSVKEDTRTLDQNAKFHALCDDIAKSGFDWAGKPRSAAQWKVLLVSAHATATEEGSEMVPGLEGEYVNLRESTALMSVRRSASLIEYTLAFMANNDIPIIDKETAKC
jgi:hypothetical protein